MVIEHVSIELMIANPLTKGMLLLKYKDHVDRMRLGSILCDFHYMDECYLY